MHPLLSAAPDLDTPTVVVFDRHPGEPAGILDAAEIGLLNSPAGFDATKTFVRSVVEVMARQMGERVVARPVSAARSGCMRANMSCTPQSCSVRGDTGLTVDDREARAGFGRAAVMLQQQVHAAAVHERQLA
jgi:hypothetical protein